MFFSFQTKAVWTKKIKTGELQITKRNRKIEDFAEKENDCCPKIPKTHPKTDTCVGLPSIKNTKTNRKT